MFDWFKKYVSDGHHGNSVQEANCPYCLHKLEKFPTRKQSCPFCHKEFVVRTHYLTKQKMVLTTEDARKYDFEKDKYYTDKSLIDGLKLSIYVDRDDVDRLVEKTREELTKKFGQPAALGDVAWGTANRMIASAAKKGNLGLINMIQFQMALYLHRCGKDGNRIRENTYENELKGYKKMGAVEGVSISSSSCCEACQKLHGQKLTIEEAFFGFCKIKM